MTSHVIDLTWSKQFHIITYSEMDFWLIMHHLIYLIFLVNQIFWIKFLNQLMQLTFSINLYWISSATGL